MEYGALLKIYGPIAGIVLLLMQAMWMMYQRPRVQDMLNKTEKHMIKNLDSKYGYKEGQPFAEREETKIKFNDLEHEQLSDMSQFADLKRRLEKLENGK